MAKIQSGPIGGPVPVWTVGPLLTRSNSLDTNIGVDNPAFYDTEAGICSKPGPLPKKKVNPDDDPKRQCNTRLVLLLVVILLLLMLLMAMVATVIYLAVGEVKEGREFEETDEGMSLVEGQIRITNRVFTKDLLQSGNPVYRGLSLQIQESMHAVFYNSLPHYNETRVLGYSEGSVIARCHIHFTKPHLDITHQVGMAVIQALERHHGYLPGGLLQVDIRSLQFTGLSLNPEEAKAEQTNPPVSTTESIEMESTDCGGNCEDGEVCLFLPQTPFSRCLVPRDASDPSGCGGWCISEHQLCKRLGNSTYQCIDNVATCKEGEWQCSNGLCIPIRGHCNGRIECYDMSDESDCECGSGRFRCGNSTPCLPESVRCNGHMDCWDASDEVNCTKSCGSDMFTCNDGNCIDMPLFCDRYPDCPDGSDEPEGCNENCLPTQKQCHNGRCINLTHWCNGVDDCKDGSDEKSCGTVLTTTPTSNTTPASTTTSTTTPASTTTPISTTSPSPTTTSTTSQS